MKDYKGIIVTDVALEKRVKLASEGNEKAFSQLVSIYEGAVYNMAMYIVKNREDALDISQEVFVKLWQYGCHIIARASHCNRQRNQKI